MDRRRQTRGAVKRCEAKPGCFVASNDAAAVGMIRTCGRIQGYIINAMKRGADYHFWDKHRFARRSGLKVEYIEEAMRRFRKTSTVFKIDETRIGRSPRLICTWRTAGGRGESLGRVIGRLHGYIRAAIRKRGYARVNARFLEFFCEATQLPPELARLAWQRLKLVPGCRSEWRGAGLDAEFYVSGVSLQESAPGYGFPTERRDIKTVAQAPGSPNKSSSAAAPRMEQLKPPTQSCPSENQATAQHAAASKCTPPARCAVGKRERTSRKSKPRQAGNGQPAAGGAADSIGAAVAAAAKNGTLFEPFRVGAHWISGQKILRYAVWLAVVPLRTVHASREMVRWRFAHSRNFAARALRAGHRADAIVAAYRVGVQRSHDDCLDAGLRGSTARGEHVRESAPREPSAAVVYAWQELLRDTRGRDERWAEILRGNRAPRPPKAPAIAKPAAPETALPAASAAAPKTALIDRREERRGKFKTLQQLFTPQEKRAADLEDGAPITLGELQHYLAPSGMTLAQFNALHWHQKKAILQRARAGRENKSPEGK